MTLQEYYQRHSNLLLLQISSEIFFMQKCFYILEVKDYYTTPFSASRKGIFGKHLLVDKEHQNYSIFISMRQHTLAALATQIHRENITVQVNSSEVSENPLSLHYIQPVIGQYSALLSHNNIFSRVKHLHIFSQFS